MKITKSRKVATKRAVEWRRSKESSVLTRKHHFRFPVGNGNWIYIPTAEFGVIKGRKKTVAEGSATGGYWLKGATK